MAISEQFQQRLKHFIIIDDYSDMTRSNSVKIMYVYYLTSSKALNYGIIPKSFSLTR